MQEEEPKYFRLTRVCNDPSGRKIDCPVGGNFVEIGGTPGIQSGNQAKKLAIDNNLLGPLQCELCGQCINGGAVSTRRIGGRLIGTDNLLL